jgi:mycoredoxin
MKLRNLAIVIIIAGIVFAMGKLSLKPVETRSTTLHTNEVVLYATDWCGYCRKTREFFKENNIAYTEYDIEKSAEAKSNYDQLNGRGIPVVVINGKVIDGYNPGLMKKLLSIE